MMNYHTSFGRTTRERFSLASARYAMNGGVATEVLGRRAPWHKRAQILQGPARA